MDIVDFLLSALQERSVLLVFLWDLFANHALMVSFPPLLFLLFSDRLTVRAPKLRESLRLLLIGFCFAQILVPFDCGVDLYNAVVILIMAGLGVSLISSLPKASVALPS